MFLNKYQCTLKYSVTSGNPSVTRHLKAPTLNEDISIVVSVITWQNFVFNRWGLSKKNLRSKIWLSPWICHWSLFYRGFWMQVRWHFIPFVLCIQYCLMYGTMNTWTLCFDFTRSICPSLTIGINWQREEWHSTWPHVVNYYVVWLNFFLPK